MEHLIAFHFNDTELLKLKQLAAILKIPFKTVETTDYYQTLGALASGKTNPLVKPFTGEAPAESLLLLCGFSEKRMDKLLLSLRKRQIQADYKAVLTPTNSQWNVLRLMLEMRAEKAAYEHNSP